MKCFVYSHYHYLVKSHHGDCSSGVRILSTFLYKIFKKSISAQQNDKPKSYHIYIWMIQNKFCCDELVLMFVWLFLRVRSRKVVWFVASNQEKTNTYISASLTFYNMKHLPLQSTSFGEHCNNYQRRVQVSVFTNIWQCVLHIIMIIMICFVFKIFF